jgi:hypothetical protein
LPREPAVSRGLCCAGDVLSLPPCSGLRVGARHSRKRQGPSPPGRRSKPAALARPQPHAPAVQHACCSAGVLTHLPRARRAGARGRPHSRPGPSEQLLDRLHGTRPAARGGRAPSAAAERGRRCSPGQVVADFMESSPAYRCGLIRIGDRITKVTDAQPTRPAPLAEQTLVGDPASWTPCSAPCRAPCCTLAAPPRPRASPLTARRPASFGRTNSERKRGAAGRRGLHLWAHDRGHLRAPTRAGGLDSARPPRPAPPPPSTPAGPPAAPRPRCTAASAPNPPPCLVRPQVVISFVDARTDRPYTVRLVRRRTASMHSPALTEGLHAQASVSVPRRRPRLRAPTRAGRALTPRIFSLA